MFVVALLAISTSVEAEAPLLAADLGVTAFEARMLLSGGFPAVVRSTVDRNAAIELLGKLRGCRHGALACDTAAVVPNSSMRSMRDFAFGDEAILESAALAGSGYRGGGERLPYDDVLCLLRAMHRRTVLEKAEERERSFSMGRTLMTGGVVLSKTTTKEIQSLGESREQVLYIYRISGATPWILRETSTRYASLGPDLSPTTIQNFLTTIRLLRQRAPNAPYDERLMTLKPKDPKSSDAGLDLLSHLTAMWLSKSDGAST